VRERVHHFIRLFDQILPDQPFEDIFLADRVDEDGDRQFETLWLLGGQVVAECQNVAVEAQEDSWDFANWGEVHHVIFNAKSFRPDEIDSDSRLRAKWSNGNGLSGIMNATGLNCKYLLGVLQAYILPRVPRTLGVD
jgi:hypothetical protein